MTSFDSLIVRRNTLRTWQQHFTFSPLFLAMLSLPALAEDGQAAANPQTTETIVVTGQQHKTTYTMPTSSVATRSNASIMDIPKAVTTVTSQVLQDQESDSLIDALTNVSGVTQTNDIGGKEDAIIRRGFGSSRDGSVLTDGLKTALPHSFNVTTEQVEVLKGPSSTLYGVLDPSGMVNVVTKKPQTEFGAKVWSKLSAMGAGRYGQKYGMDITDGISDSNFAYRFIGEYEDSDYWRNFGTNRNWTVAPSLMWSTDSTELVVSYFHQHYLIPYDRGTIYDTTKNKFVDVSRRTRLDEALSKYEGDSDMAKVTLNQALNDTWNLDTRYAYSQDDFKANQVRTLGYNSETGAVTRRADVRGFYKVKTHAVRSDLTGSVDLFQKQMICCLAHHTTMKRLAVQNYKTVIRTLILMSTILLMARWKGVLMTLQALFWNMKPSTPLPFTGKISSTLMMNGS